MHILLKTQQYKYVGEIYVNSQKPLVQECIPATAALTPCPALYPARRPGGALTPAGAPPLRLTAACSEDTSRSRAPSPAQAGLPHSRIWRLPRRRTGDPIRRVQQPPWCKSCWTDLSGPERSQCLFQFRISWAQGQTSSRSLGMQESPKSSVYRVFGTCWFFLPVRIQGSISSPFYPKEGCLVT